MILRGRIFRVRNPVAAQDGTVFHISPSADMRQFRHVKSQKKSTLWIRPEESMSQARSSIATPSQGLLACPCDSRRLGGTFKSRRRAGMVGPSPLHMQPAYCAVTVSVAGCLLQIWFWLGYPIQICPLRNPGKPERDTVCPDRPVRTSTSDFGPLLEGTDVLFRTIRNLALGPAARA